MTPAKGTEERGIEPELAHGKTAVNILRKNGKTYAYAEAFVNIIVATASLEKEEAYEAGLGAHDHEHDIEISSAAERPSTDSISGETAVELSVAETPN